MGAESAEFARIIALALAPELPPGVRLEQQGLAIGVSVDTRGLWASTAAAIIEGLAEAEDRVVQLEATATAILSGVQDAVIELTEMPWPTDKRGRTMLPAGAVENSTLKLWFESSGTGERLELSSIGVGRWLDVDR